jgi:hypothetical protein
MIRCITVLVTVAALIVVFQLRAAAQAASPLVQACVSGCVSGGVTEVDVYSLPPSAPVPSGGALPALTPQVFPVATPSPAPTGMTDPACQGADACYVAGTPAPQIGPGRWVAYAKNSFTVNGTPVVNVSDPSNTEPRFRPTPARLQ